MIKIPPHHATHPLQIGVGPGIVIRQQTHRSQPVGLNIGLINHIHSQPIAEIIKTRLMRVMGTADGVEIMLLHKSYIGFDLLK